LVKAWARHTSAHSIDESWLRKTSESLVAVWNGLPDDNALE
jgi:hypothetical protein